MGDISIRVLFDARTVKDNLANVCAFSFGDTVFVLIVIGFRAVLINITDLFFKLHEVSLAGGEMTRRNLTRKTRFLF